MNIPISSHILITGAGGFIGGWLTKWFVEHGYKHVRAVDIKSKKDWYQVHEDAENLVYDLCRLEACEFVTQDVDYVFNLAADMGGMGFIENNRAACMLSVLINTHLLMAAQREGVKRYFYASSACVYAHDKQTDPNVTALREEDAYPAMAEDGYGWEKLFSERMCRHFSEDFGMEVRVARFHNVYGPLGTYTGGREKAPAAICRKVIEAVISGNHEIEIWGDGEQTRSFMYIDDCVEGILKIFDSNFDQPINLGSAELVSINQLVSLAEKNSGIKLLRTYKKDAPQGVRGRNSNNELIQQVLGWEPSISLQEGLKKTYDWIFVQMKSGSARG